MVLFVLGYYSSYRCNHCSEKMFYWGLFGKVSLAALFFRH